MRPNLEKRAAAPQEPRVCNTCGYLLPARLFGLATGRQGKIYLRRRCVACDRKVYGLPEPRKRPPKRNAAGLYWCNECRVYQGEGSFGRIKGRVSPYCRPCARKLDAVKRRKERADPVRRLHDNEQRNLRKREARARVNRERVAFAKSSVAILRRRGLTKQAIQDLGGFSRTLVDGWERGDRLWCKPAPIKRLVSLMRATAFLPVGNELAHGTIKRHPEWNRIVEELRWEMAEL